MKAILNQDVCKKCMATEKIHLLPHNARPPVPWNNTDDAFWTDGTITCPHVSSNHSFEKALSICLKYPEQVGCLRIWDEL